MKFTDKDIKTSEPGSKNNERKTIQSNTVAYPKISIDKTAMEKAWLSVSIDVNRMP